MRNCTLLHGSCKLLLCRDKGMNIEFKVERCCVLNVRREVYEVCVIKLLLFCELLNIREDMKPSV